MAGARAPQLVQLLLLMTVVTGLVDAVSYLALGRVFVANMTGNAAGGARDVRPHQPHHLMCSWPARAWTVSYRGTRCSDTQTSWGGRLGSLGFPPGGQVSGQLAEGCQAPARPPQ